MFTQSEWDSVVEQLPRHRVLRALGFIGAVRLVGLKGVKAVVGQDIYFDMKRHLKEAGLDGLLDKGDSVSPVLFEQKAPDPAGILPGGASWEIERVVHDGDADGRLLFGHDPGLITWVLRRGDLVSQQFSLRRVQDDEARRLGLSGQTFRFGWMVQKPMFPGRVLDGFDGLSAQAVHVGSAFAGLCLKELQVQLGDFFLVFDGPLVSMRGRFAVSCLRLKESAGLPGIAVLIHGGYEPVLPIDGVGNPLPIKDVVQGKF